MNVTVKAASVASLKAAIKDTTRKIRNEIRIAVNATAKKSKSITNKQIRSELANTTSKTVFFTIKIHLSTSTDHPTARLEVKKTDRISLQHFGARQTRAGVTYQISKTRGRKLIKDAFINSTKLHGGVFKRVGKSRLPIVKPRGVSPWGVMTKGKKTGPTKTETQAELDKQVQKRIRFITLKKTGAI